MALDLNHRINALEREVARLVLFMDKMLEEKSKPFGSGKLRKKIVLVRRRREIIETTVLQEAGPVEQLSKGTGNAVPKDSLLHSNMNPNEGSHGSTGLIIDDHRPEVIIEPSTEPSVIEPSVIEPSVIEPSVIEPAVIEPSIVEASTILAGQLVVATAPKYGSIPLTARTNHKKEHYYDTTGMIIHNSFDESFKQLTADGDPHLELIVENLRREPAFERLHRWNPQNPNIKGARGQFIRWILHPMNIHKFKDPMTIQTARENSPMGELFRAVFTQLIGTKEGKGLKKVLRATLQYTDGPLATFLAAVVKVHSQHCSACDPADLFSPEFFY